MFYCEPLNLDLVVLAGVHEENTRKLGFRREKFRKKERTLANSPGELSKLGKASGEMHDANRGRPISASVRETLEALDNVGTGLAAP